MNLRDRRFERSVRRRVRRAIQASPAQRREYQRTRASRRYDTPQSVLRGLASALLAISLAKLGERNATLDAMLGLVAIWCAGFAVHYANRLRFHLYGAPPILVLALQPIGDEAIFVHQWRSFVRTCLWLLVDLAAALAVVCAFAQSSLVQWLTAIPCALALWMSVVSIATLFVRLRPGANFSALSSGLFLLILTTVVAGFYLPETTARLLDGASGPFYSIPPFGWICYVIREAVLGTSLLPLLLLLPVAMLAPALHHARKRLSANYRLFAADDSEEADDDHETELALPGNAEVETPGSPRKGIDPEQARWVVEAWRRPASPWAQPGILERWLTRFLSPREKDLAEFLTAGQTDWTANLRRASVLVVAALMAALTLGPSGLWLSYLGLYFAATNAIPLLGTPCVGLSMVQMAGTSFPAYAGLPLGMREMSRFLLKVGIMRLLTFAPVALLAGSVIGHLNSHGWSVGLLFGAKIMALLLCWQPIVVALQFSVGTNDTRGAIGRSLKLFAIFGPLILGLLGATAGTLFAPLPVSLASLAATAALSWASFRLYARLYDRNAFDLMHGQAQ